MAEKTFNIKTNKKWGKGGSILCFLLVFSLIFQPIAFASRSSAGGGKIEKFNAGKFATTIGMGLGTMAIGGALNAGFSNMGQGLIPSLATMGGSLNQSLTLGGMMANYTNFVALSQVGRAVGMAGSYYDWKPSTTFIVSNLATGATAGFLNPAATLGEALPDELLRLDKIGVETIASNSSSLMAKGAMVGGLTGLASGMAVAAIDGDKINKGKAPGVAAQVAGLTAGVAAGNFGRELIKPTAYGAVIQREAIRDVQPGSSEQFKTYAINDVNINPKADTFANRVELTGERLAEVKTKFELGNGYEARPLGQDMVYLAPQNTHISAQGLLDAAFVKTADMWPQLATRALSIAVSESFSEKGSWAASLVSSAVEGVAAPVISGAAEIYALKPGLYLGGNQTVNRVMYVDRMNQLAYQQRMDKEGAALYQVHINNGTRDDYQQLLNEHKLANVTAADALSYTEFKQAYRDSWDKGLSTGVLTEKAYQENLDRLANFNETGYKPEDAMLGVTASKVGIEIQGQMKALHTLQERFEIAQTSRAGLFWNNLTKDAKFGLVEGLVNGGVTSLVSRINDPLAGAVAGYGATMLTSAVRGVLWHANWETSRDDYGNLAWSDKFSLYTPQHYEGDDFWQQKIDEYTYPGELDRFKEFGRISGLPLVAKNRDIVKETAAGEIKQQNIETFGYDLSFPEQKPELKHAIYLSMSQANREFLNRSFAFGAPQVHPKYINTLILTDYLNNLRGYVIPAGQAGGFADALSRSYVNAASQAASTNVLTSLASSSSLAEVFNIQQQRLTSTSSPLNLLTIQTKDYKPWALGVETSFYLPFPNDNYRARSITGKSFTRDK